EPTLASSDLGYIRDGSGIIEKPSSKCAGELIERGYMWNTAIYAYSLRFMLEAYRKHFNFAELSFDRSMLPHFIDKTKVINGEFIWLDIGTLKAFQDFEEEKWKGSRGIIT